MFGQEILALDAEEEQNMKSPLEKHIKLIGFISNTEVLDQCVISSVEEILPSIDSSLEN